jgi:hypothetical protein
MFLAHSKLHLIWVLECAWSQNPYEQTALKQGMDGELHPANENLFGVIRTIHISSIKECDLCMDSKSDELNLLFLLPWISIIWTRHHHTPQSYWWYFKPLGAKLQSRDSGKIRSHNWCTASLNYWIFAHQYNKLPASKSLPMSPKLEWKNKSQVPCRSLIQVGSSVGAKLKSGWDKLAPGCSLGWVCSGLFFSHIKEC